MLVACSPACRVGLFKGAWGSAGGPRDAYRKGKIVNRTKRVDSSAREYVRELIHADHKRGAEEALETRLLEGLKSPERVLTPVEWKVIRSEAVARMNATSKKSG
jgi:hypothetical protein